MENENITLGKMDKNVCYLKNGLYCYYFLYNKVNYKVSEWMPHDKVDIEIAERSIEYKIKYLIGHHEYTKFKGSKIWKETDPNYQTVKSDPGDEFMNKLREKFKKLRKEI